MAAFAPQPVIVGSLAKAPTFDRLIFFAANSEVVSSTSCLDWQPVPTGPSGEARVQLKTFQAVKAFLSRCRILGPHGRPGRGPSRARATITRNDALARAVRSRAFQRQRSRTFGGWSVLGNP